MALELIKISEFPQVTEPGEWIPVSGADGIAYKISQADFKAWLGTVQTIAPREISPTDPEPGLDGLYIPTEDGDYPLIGLDVDRSEGGADYGMYVQFINDGGSWGKVNTPMPMPENKIPDWTAGTYVQGEQRKYAGKWWEVDVASTSEEPGTGGDWKEAIDMLQKSAIKVQIVSNQRFDRTNYLRDKAISWGNIIDVPNALTSVPIPIPEGEDYVTLEGLTLGYQKQFMFLDSQGQMIGSVIEILAPETGGVFSIPTGATHIQVTFRSPSEPNDSVLDSFFLYFGNEPLSKDKYTEGVVAIGDDPIVVKPQDTFNKLLYFDYIDNTEQVPTFSGEDLTKIEHINSNEQVVRTDTFTYGTNTITEVRTLPDGESLEFINNLETLKTEVIYHGI